MNLSAADIHFVIGTLDRSSAQPRRLTPKEAEPVTIGQFRALALQRGWSEDWLVEQCKDEMDNPREIIREILAGRGLTKPWFTGESTKLKLVDMRDTVLVWGPLLALYETRTATCGCGCNRALKGKQQYATPACRKRVSRLRKEPHLANRPS
jgi:hypothetical protein